MSASDYPDDGAVHRVRRPCEGRAMKCEGENERATARGRGVRDSLAACVALQARTPLAASGPPAVPLCATLCRNVPANRTEN